MNIHDPNLLQLKLAADFIRSKELPNVEPLTEGLLNQLVGYTIKVCTTDDYSELFEKPSLGACGCMGPKDGNPFCNCLMRNYIYEYRYDIALRIQISLRLHELISLVTKVTSLYK